MAEYAKMILSRDAGRPVQHSAPLFAGWQRCHNLRQFV